MKKGRYQSPKANSPNWIVILLLLLILLISILIFILLRPKQMEVSTPNGMSYIDTGPVEKNQGSISIPGYESITLTAGEKKQTVGLPNPAKNSCYFQISLILEDGTLLWQSNLVEPGEISDPILLNEPLAAGSYSNVIMKYDCYTMDGSMTPLNGAATKLILRVQ